MACAIFEKDCFLIRKHSHKVNMDYELGNDNTFPAPCHIVIGFKGTLEFSVARMGCTLVSKIDNFVSSLAPGADFSLDVHTTPPSGSR